jgi:hypothetical protein
VVPRKAMLVSSVERNMVVDLKGVYLRKGAVRDRKRKREGYLVNGNLEA